jgi:hypothetical protein
MTPEQREKFCEENKVTLCPSYDPKGQLVGWYAYCPQKMIHAYGSHRQEAIEMLAKMMEVMK